MAYGILKCDTITFTDAGVDKSVTISGLVQNPTFTGNVTATGTISGNTVRGQTISGVTVTGTTAQFTSGTFTSLTGVTVTGTTANFTSGNFTNISGGTHTITSGVFALGTAANPSISFVSDPNSGLYSPGADQVAISTNGTGRLFIGSAGNLGIGTANPTAFVQSEGSIKISAENSFFTIDANTNDRIGFVKKAGSTPFFAAGSATSFVFSHSSGTSISDPTNQTFSERMRLDSSGRLGLGTSSPAGELHVASFGNTNLRISSSFSNSPETCLQIDTVGDSSIPKVHFSKSGTIRGGFHYNHAATGTAERLDLNVSGGAPKLSILGSGNVGIGTTAPQTSLVISNAGANGLEISPSASAGAASLIQSYNRTTSAYSILNYAAIQHVFSNGVNERARIDGSGRLLVGTSLSVTNGQGEARLQVTTNSSNYYTADFGHFSNDAFAGAVYFKKTRSTTAGGFASVVDGDFLGDIRFAGADGTDYIRAAAIECRVDGTPGTNDMPGRIVLSTTSDGASSPTEALRITNDRVIAYNQAAPAAVNATATLTVANLKTGIITSTSAAATDMTLPTGTDTQAGFRGVYDNMTFEWSVINTGPSLVRVLAGTAHTIVGSGSVATGTSGRFASRRTADNTFVTYRLS